MIFQLLPLTLLPLAAMASPVMERSKDDKDLYCFHQGQDQMYSVSKTVTKSVCDTLNSGSIQQETALKACRVKEYDVKWFKERCESHNSNSDATEWMAGSELDVAWDPKEPYHLYCFVNTVTFHDDPFKATTTISPDANPKVCGEVKGTYNDDPTKKWCKVDKENVDAFKKKCDNFYPSGYPPDYSQWIPGTSMRPVIS